MGYVFEAVDPKLHRQVALKVMSPDAAAHPQGRTRFLCEARAVAALKHDHVVPIYQVGEEGGVPFLVMPLLAGEGLDRLLEWEGRLPVEQAIRIGKQIAAGLAAAHAARLVHRDIKPANVWLEAPDGRVKLLDFGLAREELGGETPTRLTKTGAVLGTPGYMAPEQVDGKVDARTDLFALGCILYEMTTGQPPFVADGLLGLMAQLARHDPPPASRLNPLVSPELSALIEELLSKQPARRPASAEVVLGRLGALEAPPVLVATPLVLPPALPNWAARPAGRSTLRGWLERVAWFGMVVFFCLAVIAVLLLRRATSRVEELAGAVGTLERQVADAEAVHQKQQDTAVRADPPNDSAAKDEELRNARAALAEEVRNTRDVLALESAAASLSASAEFVARDTAVQAAFAAGKKEGEGPTTALVKANRQIKGLTDGIRKVFPEFKLNDARLENPEEGAKDLHYQLGLLGRTELFRYQDLERVRKEATKNAVSSGIYESNLITEEVRKELKAKADKITNANDIELQRLIRILDKDVETRKAIRDEIQKCQMIARTTDIPELRTSADKLVQWYESLLNQTGKKVRVPPPPEK
jgi:hypothetical protein